MYISGVTDQFENHHVSHSGLR